MASAPQTAGSSSAETTGAASESVKAMMITPHVCRHTYCSNMAKAGMNPKTLQYLMGHSDITVTLDTYTHLGLEDAAEEMKRLEEVERARLEQEKLNRHKDDDDSGIVVAM